MSSEKLLRHRVKMLLLGLMDASQTGMLFVTMKFVTIMVIQTHAGSHISKAGNQNLWREATA